MASTIATPTSQIPPHSCGKNYEFLLNSSLQALLAALQLRNPPNSAGFISNFQELVQSKVDPPLESIWVLTSLSFNDNVKPKIDSLNRILAIKGLFQLIVSYSASCNVVKSIALVAPVLCKLHYCVLDVKDIQLGSKKARKVNREIKSLVDSILGYLDVCSDGLDNEFDDLESLICPLEDLVSLWISDSGVQNQNVDSLKAFFPILGLDIVRRVRVKGCGMMDHAGFVVVEATLLKLCLKIREEGFGEKIQNELKYWLIGSITGFQSSHIYGTFFVKYFEMFHQQVFTNFAQQHEEPFYAAWERFNDLANNFRYHDFSNYSLLKFFINGLDAGTRRWVINGALTTGSPLFCLDDDSMMHLLDDMADFDYYRYWDLSPQCWSDQYEQEDHYPYFIDQPFELQRDEEDRHELIMTQLENTVNDYVALTEVAIEDQMDSRRHFEEQIESIRESILHLRREHDVKTKTQVVVHPILLDEDDSNDQAWESNSHHDEDLETLEPSHAMKPQLESVLNELSDEELPRRKLLDDGLHKTVDLSSSIVFSYTHPQDPSLLSPSFSEVFVYREPTPLISSRAYYCLESVVEEMSLQCLYQAKLEGIWNQDPYVVSYDTYYGRQPLFDAGF